MQLGQGLELPDMECTNNKNGSISHQTKSKTGSSETRRVRKTTPGVSHSHNQTCCLKASVVQSGGGGGSLPP